MSDKQEILELTVSFINKYEEEKELILSTEGLAIAKMALLGAKMANGDYEAFLEYAVLANLVKKWSGEDKNER